MTKETLPLTEQERLNLQVLLSGLRMIRGNRREHLAYVGMPITTGKRYYEVLSSAGVRNKEELAAKLGPQAFWELVMQPNIQDGTAFADQLGLSRQLLFFSPSVFDAKPWQWSQDAYMALFYNVMAELSGSHFVANGWEYSVGGVKEIFFSMLMQFRYIRLHNLRAATEVFGLESLFCGLSEYEQRTMLRSMAKMKVYDAQQEEITLDKALQLCVDAIADLQSRGFDTSDLIGLAWSLKTLPFVSPFFNTPEMWESRTYFQARTKLERLVSAAI
jgi:hypothetical protein